MIKTAFTKTIGTSLLLFSLLFVSVSLVKAVEYSREQIKVDRSLADQNTKQYAQPTQILITQIKTDTSALEVDSANWFRTLYYYTITRLGYVDIPFTYVVDREGNIYHGRDGGPTVSPELNNDQGGVVIGFLSNSSDIPVEASGSIQGLVSQLSYKYGIQKKNTKPVILQTKRVDNGRARSTFIPADNAFAMNVSDIVDGISFSDHEHLSYKAQITEVKYEKTVKAGEKLAVQVVVKNLNDFPWFTDKDFIYLSTKSGKDSRFAINGVWKSFSKPVEISKKTVLPGESITLNFDMQALFLPGKYAESFTMLKLPKTKFDGSDFNVNFEITKGNFKLVQVKGTPSGILNVRECPAGSCKSVATLSEGQVVVMVEKSLAGWYKVRYTDKKEGWVYAPYIKEL